MAERRMFAKTVIDSDAFIEMPLSAQALYFHLAMRADDDGFVNSPNRIRKDVGAAEDDMKLLVLKRFVIAFESGVIVIKHWKIHNYIQSDRYKPTVYTKEMALLTICENKAYTDCIHHVSTADTQVRVRLELGKVNTHSNAYARETKAYGQFENVMLTEEEHDTFLKTVPDGKERIEIFSCKLKAKGYQYENHYATLLLWCAEEKKASSASKKKSDARGGYPASFDAEEFFEAALKRTYEGRAKDAQ
ncbi:MAG: replisome organizer [Clostridia bacterium]|nr:replisome organizer [Clostridia bacterium]